MIERTSEYDTKLSQSLKDKDLIDIGDKVNVMLNGDGFMGIVRYKSCNTGDSWIFEDENGNIRYVQNFIQIIKYKEIDKKDIPF